MLGVIPRLFRDAAQLTNKQGARNALTYGYLGLLGFVTILANYRYWSYTQSHPDGIARVLYLIVALILLTSVRVRLERGHLTLSAIVIGTAAIFLNPLDATILGLALSIPMAGRGRWPILGNSIM